MPTVVLTVLAPGALSEFIFGLHCSWFQEFPSNLEPGNPEPSTLTLNPINPQSRLLVYGIVRGQVFRFVTVRMTECIKP